MNISEKITSLFESASLLLTPQSIIIRLAFELSKHVVEENHSVVLTFNDNSILKISKTTVDYYADYYKKID